MTFSRYQNIGRFRNDKDLYRHLFEKRDVNYINQFRTGKLRYPTDEELSSLNVVSHSWSRGDRLYKLAFTYYGSTELWWVIAWFNKKPSEALFSLGDIVYIPLPLERAVELMGL